jgi:hypothetical protein
VFEHAYLGFQRGYLFLENSFPVVRLLIEALPVFFLQLGQLLAQAFCALLRALVLAFPVAGSRKWVAKTPAESILSTPKREDCRQGKIVK